MPFQKGKSGNPGGRPVKDKSIQDLARSHCPKAIQALVESLDDPKARVSAASVLLDRGYGKAPQFSTGNAGEFRKAIEMSDDELASIATGSGDASVEAASDPAQLH